MPTFRKAIAMIELIFAITVMGIVMMSAPMLINRATQSSYVALQQESIATATAQMQTIMGAFWDANDTNGTFGAPVLTTASSTLAPCSGGVQYPSGVTVNDGRYCKKEPSLSTLSASTILGTEGTEGNYYDDIDDYNGASYKVTVYQSEAYATYMGDYIDTNITVSSTVSYGDDTPYTTTGSSVYQQTTTFSNPFAHTATTTTSNIKFISVILTSTNSVNEIATKNIRLSAFMCNIGAPKEILWKKVP